MSEEQMSEEQSPTRQLPSLPIDDVLATAGAPGSGRVRLGPSIEGRDLIGYRFGQGPQHVSLIAGCHADEPVGPAMLDRLAAYLGGLDDDAPLLEHTTWFLVPHANPDGEARNAPWTWPAFGASATDGAVIDLGLYLRHAVRELPGDDVEFGFPHSEADLSARPENRAVADFLRPGAPFVLHASFHGMAYAAGPWFLMEAAWVDRTADMRQDLRDRVRELGYRLHDVDRRGEKGFHRIDEGFTTRPDSRAMAAHFESLGDPKTAALFRPSSMELVRSLGGDPLTLVSEMPLFVLPPEHYRGTELVRPAIIHELQKLANRNPAQASAKAPRVGIEPMPIVDQMRLQLEYLNAGLAAASGHS